MAKYIKITTSAGREMLIPAGEGLYVERTDATAMRIYSVGAFGHHFELATVDSTFAMVTAINDALVKAAETSWTNAVVPVVLPSGETVSSVAVTVFS